MAATLLKTPMTAEEFFASSESDDHELVHGVPQEMPMGARSGWIVGECLGQIRDHLKSNPVGILLQHDAGIALWPDPSHFRRPDVMVIRRGRLAGNRLTDKLIRTVPDLIVEVVSPGDEMEKFEQKMEDYRSAGVPLVWVIYPEPRNAHVHRRGKPIDVVYDLLDGEDILPGFSLNLRALFEAAEKAAQP